jgi:hypothetical protein
MRVVALPAEVLLTVTGHIYPRNIFCAVGIWGMTLAAELSYLWLLGGEASRSHEVLLLRLMADSALKVGMPGECQGPLDLSVAGFTALGGLRRLGIVGLMAGDACFHRIMGVGDHLGEACGT